MDWVHTAPAVLAAFGGSLVECVEALTIVLAVAVVRGWRPALLGTAAGAGVLALLIASLGTALATIPIAVLQIAIGILLLAFGLRWLRKAVQRAAGLIPLRDEMAAYARAAAAIGAGGIVARWDPVAVATAFKAVLVEGLEVVFVVLAVGAAGRMLPAASIGAGLAALLVIALGAVLHRPLARVPENALKYGVGVLLVTFGLFWLGEGLGLRWPGGDLAIFALATGVLGLAALATVSLRRRGRVLAAR
jgi:uncharacterized membrane protein